MARDLHRLLNPEQLAAVQAVDDCISELKPIVEQLWPELIGEAVPVSP